MYLVVVLVFSKIKQQWKTADYVSDNDLPDPGLPVTYGLHIFDALELKFTHFRFVLCMELTL